MISTDVLVIGGGASGIMAALVATDLGAKVMIVEGESRIAKKILTTGNGRCNITNKKIRYPYVNYHSDNPQFFHSVLNQLSVDETIDLFNMYGLPIIELDEGKCYPQSLQASSVVDILLLNIEEKAIPVYLNSKVVKIEKKQDVFIVETNNEDNRFFYANKVLIACGGCAAPMTGSDGSIYQVVKKLGHRIINSTPSIVQLKLDCTYLKAISGVRFDALAKVYIDDELKRQEYDEVLFTDYGISGPAILQLSRCASTGLSNNRKIKIIIDLFSKLGFQELTDYLENRYILFGHRSIYQALIGVIHKKLIPSIIKTSGIDDIHKTCDSLSYQEKVNLCKVLKNWTFICNGTNDFHNAQTTVGGVDTKDIDCDTLESKLVKGLYFSGEVMDVDGDCGGYNLQWAWSSGYVAGKNISKP